MDWPLSRAEANQHVIRCLLQELELAEGGGGGEASAWRPAAPQASGPEEVVRANEGAAAAAASSGSAARDWLDGAAAGCEGGSEALAVEAWGSGGAAEVPRTPSPRGAELRTQPAATIYALQVVPLFWAAEEAPTAAAGASAKVNAPQSVSPPTSSSEEGAREPAAGSRATLGRRRRRRRCRSRAMAQDLLEGRQCPLPLKYGFVHFAERRRSPPRAASAPPTGARGGAVGEAGWRPLPADGPGEGERAEAADVAQAEGSARAGWTVNAESHGDGAVPELEDVDCNIDIFLQRTGCTVGTAAAGTDTKRPVATAALGMYSVNYVDGELPKFANDCDYVGRDSMRSTGDGDDLGSDPPKLVDGLADFMAALGADTLSRTAAVPKASCPAAAASADVPTGSGILPTMAMRLRTDAIDDANEEVIDDFVAVLNADASSRAAAPVSEGGCPVAEAPAASTPTAIMASKGNCPAAAASAVSEFLGEPAPSRMRRWGRSRPAPRRTDVPAGRPVQGAEPLLVEDDLGERDEITVKKLDKEEEEGLRSADELLSPPQAAVEPEPEENSEEDKATAGPADGGGSSEAARPQYSPSGLAVVGGDFEEAGAATDSSPPTLTVVPAEARPQYSSPGLADVGDRFDGTGAATALSASSTTARISAAVRPQYSPPGLADVGGALSGTGRATDSRPSTTRSAAPSYSSTLTCERAPRQLGKAASSGTKGRETGKGGALRPATPTLRKKCEMWLEDLEDIVLGAYEEIEVKIEMMSDCVDQLATGEPQQRCRHTMRTLTAALQRTESALRALDAAEARLKNRPARPMVVIREGLEASIIEIKELLSSGERQLDFMAGIERQAAASRAARERAAAKALDWAEDAYETAYSTWRGARTPTARAAASRRLAEADRALDSARADFKRTGVG